MAGFDSFTKQYQDPLFKFLQLYDDSYHTKFAFSHSFLFVSPPFPYHMENRVLSLICMFYRHLYCGCLVFLEL